MLIGYLVFFAKSHVSNSSDALLILQIVFDLVTFPIRYRACTKRLKNSMFYPAYVQFKRERKGKQLLMSYNFHSFQLVLGNAPMWRLFKQQAIKDLCVENCLFYEQVYIHSAIFYINNRSQTFSKRQTAICPSPRPSM